MTIIARKKRFQLRREKKKPERVLTFLLGAGQRSLLVRVRKLVSISELEKWVKSWWR